MQRRRREPIDQALQTKLTIIDQKEESKTEGSQENGGDRGDFHGCGYGRGRGRSKDNNQGRDQRYDKRNVRCYTCNKFGHYATECRSNNVQGNANYASKEGNDNDILTSSTPSSVDRALDNTGVRVSSQDLEVMLKFSYSQPGVVVASSIGQDPSTLATNTHATRGTLWPTSLTRTPFIGCPLEEGSTYRNLDTSGLKSQIPIFLVVAAVKCRPLSKVEQKQCMHIIQVMDDKVLTCQRTVLTSYKIGLKKEDITLIMYLDLVVPIRGAITLSIIFAIRASPSKFVIPLDKLAL
ncbi:hypothetical protein ZIOFF_050687 [Zingiber officinale]|uniref:CCHC-type domain-containing protein n=1 Tax=Zingiber officinale TaxID=94328 RepID=A0A8J5FKL6_ZINOF|nr:hypothetical protein ZIOFF_050687 [Zingiber officinale]